MASCSHFIYLDDPLIPESKSGRAFQVLLKTQRFAGHTSRSEVWWVVLESPGYASLRRGYEPQRRSQKESVRFWAPKNGTL